VKYAPLLQM